MGIKIAIFGLGTVLIVWVSWGSLKNWRSHGFYRFFAWEMILALILINMNDWFTDPLSPYQLISWFLLILSLAWLIPGVRLMYKEGKPDKSRNDDPSLVGIEKTSQLITSGIFKYIRNPLYSSLLFLVWGAFFKHPSWIGFAMAISTSIFLFATANIEEKENIRYFGDSYQQYMEKSKMFIPFIW